MRSQVGRNDDPLLDAACLLAVREAVGPSVELRADANRSWSRDAAIAFGRAVQTANLAFVEEPVAKPAADLAAFHAATAIPVALDESLDEGASLRPYMP
jgi:L-alanine-DL-glutamate epimerase-like enolase superfamily enzyme